MNWPVVAIIALIFTLMFGSLTVTEYARHAYAHCPEKAP
jgi:hypothetical protein